MNKCKDRLKWLIDKESFSISNLHSFTRRQLKNMHVKTSKRYNQKMDFSQHKDLLHGFKKDIKTSCKLELSAEWKEDNFKLQPK